jgi:hypothetical protein
MIGHLRKRRVLGSDKMSASEPILKDNSEAKIFLRAIRYLPKWQYNEKYLLHTRSGRALFHA